MVCHQPCDQLMALCPDVTGTVERMEARGCQLLRVSDVVKIGGCDQDVFEVAESRPDLTREPANSLYVNPPAAQRRHEALSRPYRPPDEIAHPDTVGRAARCTLQYVESPGHSSLAAKIRRSVPFRASHCRIRLYEDQGPRCARPAARVLASLRAAPHVCRDLAVPRPSPTKPITLVPREARPQLGRLRPDHETGSLVIGKTGNMQLEPDVALEPADGVGAERGSDRGPGQLWQLGRE